MDEAEFLQVFGVSRWPVPQAAPSDMKALWKLGEDTKKSRPKGNVAIGVNLMAAYCKPGANIGAITYRARIIGILQHIAPEIMTL